MVTPPVTEGQIAKRLSDAIAEYEAECGERVRIHDGACLNTFIVEYSDGEEYIVTVKKQVDMALDK